MQREVTEEKHPEHVGGGWRRAGLPLVALAGASWHHIDVRFNCEPHHVIFAVEYYLRVQPYWVIWV